jgi:hypothetical protein
MCESCGKSHGKQRQSRGHDVCFGIYGATPVSKDLRYKSKKHETYSIEEEMKNELSLEQKQPKTDLYCHPCMRNDNHQTPVSGVCYSSNIQRSFCSSCIKDHQQIHEFTNHKIELDLDNLQRGIPETIMNRYCN